MPIQLRVFYNPLFCSALDLHNLFLMCKLRNWQWTRDFNTFIRNLEVDTCGMYLKIKEGPDSCCTFPVSCGSQ